MEDEAIIWDEAAIAAIIAGAMLLLPQARQLWRQLARGQVNNPSADVLLRLSIQFKEQMKALFVSDQSIADLQNAMKDLITIEFLIALFVQLGDWSQVTQAAVNENSEELQKQLAFLQNMAIEIETGQQPQNGSLLTRVGLYGVAIWAIYQGIKGLFARRAGATHAGRILGVADHCVDCKAWEIGTQGIVPIDEMQPIGSSVCSSNCHCGIEYYRRLNGRFEQVTV